MKVQKLTGVDNHDKTFTFGITVLAESDDEIGEMGDAAAVASDEPDPVAAIAEIQKSLALLGLTFTFTAKA